MRAQNLIASLLVTCFVLLLSSCSEWGTRYSGKYDETDNIRVFLHQYGRIGLGHSGIGREIVQTYSFELQPIKRVYIDDEINLTKGVPGPTIPVKGTLLFNADYTKVTLDIQIEIEGQFQPFAGNGTYSVNEN
jgi:hypothetical protein